MTDADNNNLIWHKVSELGDLVEGRVKTVTAAGKQLALVHYNGKFAAMDNRCPHQGGPLGEGSIETGADGRCWLRCPWHGWDFDPLTGKPPGGHADTGQQMYPVDVRVDGIYIGLEPVADRSRTVTDVMVETMVEWGVKSVFGMVGHSNLGLAEALRVQETAGKLTYYGIRHEGAASFACAGYAKLTGQPAACLAIAGPGATNLLTGLWDAKVDRAPVLAMTGQVNVQVFGPGAFQEIDLASAFQAVSRFSQTVLHTSRHAELMALALKNAIVERDVAHLIFPDDVQTLPGDRAKPALPSGRLSETCISPSASEFDAAAMAIAAARRPIIVVGYGARDGMEDIVALAEVLNAPVLTTFKAKGQISDNHPLAAGVLGRSGTPIASWFMNETDLIIAFGASFSNHTGIDPARPIVQVDFERMALGKFHPVAYPVWGEVATTARLFRKAIGRFAAQDQRPELAARWSSWREEKRSRLEDDTGHGINSASVFDALTAAVPDNAIIALDVGNNTYSFGRYFECERQRVLMSGYLGSIGFSFPAAMGAWAATQDLAAFADRKVVSVSGDGGFGQYMGEFTTAVKYNMDITHILLNNAQLGKISKEQQAGEWPIWQTSLVNPSFAAYARLCGGKGIKVTDRSELRSAIDEALDFNGPALVEIMTDAELI
ncbi:MAG: thiamine pyrophosphate-dependent enzyme [Hyphomicrobiaceae bacterium]